MLDGNSDILLGNSYDPDLNLFSENIKNLDTTRLLPGKLHNFLDNSVTDWFLILHLNIRSIKINSKNFKLFLSSLGFSLSVMCFSETWLDDFDNSTYELPNYISKHQARSDHRGGGVSIYIHNSLKFKERFNISIKDIESLMLEILSDKIHSVLVNVLYKPPAGQHEQLENFLTTFFSQTKAIINIFILQAILILIYWTTIQIKRCKIF